MIFKILKYTEKIKAIIDYQKDFRENNQDWLRNISWFSIQQDVFPFVKKTEQISTF